MQRQGSPSTKILFDLIKFNQNRKTNLFSWALERSDLDETGHFEFNVSKVNTDITAFDLFNVPFDDVTFGLKSSNLKLKGNSYPFELNAKATASINNPEFKFLSFIEKKNLPSELYNKSRLHFDEKSNVIWQILCHLPASSYDSGQINGKKLFGPKPAIRPNRLDFSGVSIIAKVKTSGSYLKSKT